MLNMCDLSKTALIRRVTAELKGETMRILVLGDGRPDLATIASALRLGDIEILTEQSAGLVTGSLAGRWRFEDWTLDVVTRRCVGPDGARVELTSSEYDLLTAFLRHPGQALSRNTLMRELRGRSWTYFDRSIDALVARLRKKIDLDRARPRFAGTRRRLRLLRPCLGGGRGRSVAWKSSVTTGQPSIPPR